MVYFPLPAQSIYDFHWQGVILVKTRNDVEGLNHRVTGTERHPSIFQGSELHRENLDSWEKVVVLHFSSFLLPFHCLEGNLKEIHWRIRGNTAETAREFSAILLFPTILT